MVFRAPLWLSTGLVTTAGFRSLSQATVVLTCFLCNQIESSEDVCNDDDVVTGDVGFLHH